MVSSDGVLRVTSADGTELAGRVHGSGPPLVMVPGGLADGETTNYRLLLHRLATQFTCVLMSTRGRGLSADHPDRSTPRLVEDVTAFVEAFDAPVGLVGHSRGGVLALHATATNDQVVAVAAWEPVVLQLRGPDELARLRRAIQQLRRLVDAGDLEQATTVYFREVMQISDAEYARVTAAGVLASRSTAIAEVLREAEQQDLDAPRDLPAAERVPIPVLLLTGSRTHPGSAAVTKALADHLTNARVQAIDGVGHLGMMTAATEIAEALEGFFTPALIDGRGELTRS